MAVKGYSYELVSSPFPSPPTLSAASSTGLAISISLSFGIELVCVNSVVILLNVINETRGWERVEEGKD